MLPTMSPLDTRLLELDGCMHVAVLVEGEEPGQPAVAPRAARTEHKVLGYGVLAPLLTEREV